MKNSLLVVALFFATIFTISFAASCESNSSSVSTTDSVTVVTDSVNVADSLITVPGTFGIDTVVADSAK
jgi:hypothetical protein